MRKFYQTQEEGVCGQGFGYQIEFFYQECSGFLVIAVTEKSRTVTEQIQVAKFEFKLLDFSLPVLIANLITCLCNTADVHVGLDT